MDLVKIGFLIKADGLVKANKEIDALLAKADKLNNLGGAGGGTGGGSNGSGGKGLSSSERMLKQQQLLSNLLPTLDRQTAAVVARFQMASSSVADLNRFMTLLGNNQAIVKQQQETAKLAAEQSKLTLEAEKARQKKLLAEQKYYEKQMELASKASANDIVSIKKAQEAAEKARQQRMQAEQTYYQKQMELARKAAESEAKTQKRAQKDADKARQRRFAASQNYYQQEMARIERLAQAERDRISNYNKQIALTNKIAQNQRAGLSTTNASKLARMELSGADAATVERYKKALLSAQAATQSLGNTTTEASKKLGFWNSQIGGIVKYAILSTAIYSVITAIKTLAVSFVTMADEYTSIQNRMKLYINDASTLTTVNRNLGKMSMENNVGLRETATLYTRLAPALQKIGGNAATVTAVVDAFGKSMRIGGATAMEAASATIQFSQAMASGKLAGDEFRSISEASPRFLKAIAEGSGIATESLKKLSSEGFLTTSLVARALLREYPKLIEENKKLGVTLEQGGNAFKTAFIMAVGELNEGAKVTETIGNALMDVAKSLGEFAQTARKTGTEVKASFEKYLPVIETIGKVLEFVAIVAITKFAASMIIAGATAGAAMIKTTVQVAGLVRTLGIANAAAFALSVTMARLGGGGLATLGLTIAGVAASYLLFRDNAAQANEKLAESGVYADMTAESFRKLSAEKQKNALFDLEKKAEEANKNLMSSYKDVIGVMQNYYREMSRNNLQSKDTPAIANIIKQVKAGTMSFETATRQLAEMKVPDNVISSMRSTTKVYIDAAKAANQVIEPARKFGSNVKLAGNEAQNATPAIQGMKDGVDGLAAASLNTADSFAKMVEGFRTGVADIKTTLKVMQSYDLDKGIAQQLIKESQGIAKQDTVIVDAYSKIKKAHELALNSLGDKPDKKRVDAINKHYSALLKGVQANEKRLAEEWVKLGAPAAKELQDWTDKESKFISDQRKKDKPPKKSDIDNFPEQLAFAQEYVKLLNQGVDLDVAKIAATKEYSKWYGNNLAMAYKMAAVDKQRADIEKQIQEAEQSRATKDQGLKDVVKDLEKMKTISKFVSEGFTPSVAAKAAGLGFVANAEGVLYAQKATTLTLEEQVGALRDSAIEKRNIFELTKSGKTVEQAQIDNLLYTNSHLLPEQITLLEQIKELQVDDRRADTLQKVVADSNTMLREAAIYAAMQNNELGGVAVSFDMINKSEVQHLNSWKDIVQAVKDYNDYLVNQKANPLGDFSNINFDVFGDFGNPFQSALDGLNLMLGGVDSLKQKYTDMYASLDQQTKDAAGNKKALDKIELVRQTTMSKEIVDQKKLKDDQISSALKATKSMFKEESKGYKVVSKLEQVYQASQIAFQMWKNREKIKETALELWGYAKTAASYVATTATKIAAEGGLNIVKAIGAVLTQGTGDPYTAFARMAAMAAIVAGLGVAIASNIGGDSGSVTPANDGTGTVFGDSTAKSESINNSIEILSENSDLMLPLTSAMLRSLRNIESSLGGVANLIIRGDVGNIAGGLTYADKLTGVVGTANKIYTGISTTMMNVLTLGLDKLLFGGALGDLTGGIITTLLGGLFGKTSAEVTGSGLFGGAQSLGNVMDGGFNLSQYADITTTKKSWLSKKTSYSTQYQAVSKELSDQFGLIFTNVYDSILSASSVLGRDENGVIQKLRDSIINIGKIDTKGKTGEEIQEALESVIGQQSDLIAKGAVGGLDDFQKVGEGYFETLMRVATGIETASYFTDRLNVTTIKYNDIINKQGDVAAEMVRQAVLLVEGNKNINGGFYDLVNTFDGTAEELTDFVFTLRDLQDQLFMTGKSGEYLTSAMILGAGGLDVLSSGFDAYFEMLSPAEQAAELTRRLTNEFAIFGEKLPANVTAYRDLVNSITDAELATEAGQKLYGQILALAPEFNDLQDALSSTNSDVNALVKSLRDLAEQARAARGETEQPRNLAYTRSQFEQASVLAMQGDIASAEKLLTLGKDLMGLSKTYSVTGSEYARDLALIQRAATVSADIQEQGLGTSISTTLTPSAGSTTTPTVNTNTTSTDAKLDALRADMITAITAVAKYTQDTANRLERWDYGDRMVVRVEQDATDAPISVKVTP